MKPMLAISLFLGLLSCGANASAAEGEGPATFKVSEFTFIRPAQWTWIASNSPMRAAQLAVKNPANGDPCEVVFFYFGPGNGGGTDANVERWLGQFKEPKSELKAKVEKAGKGGGKLTYVQAEGTYMSGTPAGPKTPKPGYMLMGAILESTKGNVFVKMTGPADLTAQAQADFRRMVESGLK